MKVLIICSGNAPKGQKIDLKLHHAFIHEQVESVKSLGVEFDYFLIKGRGLWGYFKHHRKLIRTLGNNYDLIHAHNGLSGFIANLQSKVPVITTFHGSDINLFLLRLVSYFPLMKSARSIFVSERQLKKVILHKKISVIPCGIDLKIFYRSPESTVLNSSKKKVILFSSSFSISIKNYPLAKKAMGKIGDENLELIELKNKTREEVCCLMNSSSSLLMTSFSEGSPMVIKEAMACNTPIVSTDVGDVKEVFGNTEGCFLTSFDPEDVAEKIRLAIAFSEKTGFTDGRRRIIELGLDSESIAKKVMAVYKEVVEGRK